MMRCWKFLVTKSCGSVLLTFLALAGGVFGFANTGVSKSSSTGLAFVPVRDGFGHRFTGTRYPFGNQIAAWPERSDDDDRKDLIRGRSFLRVAASSSSEMSSAAGNSTVSYEAFQAGDRKSPPTTRLEMPWSQTQEWALKDSLPRYTLVLPMGNPEKLETFVLWRRLLQDVVELSGYPIEFLQDRCERLIADQEITSTSSLPGILPYLDDFSFEPSGGLSGRVYGVPGVADGSMIETTAVGQVEVTLNKGYIRTKEGTVAYELGKPLEVETGYSLGDYTREGKQMIQAIGKTASMSSRGNPTKTVQEEDPDLMLLRLGASTGLLLAGATAMNMLSHHLTVNVFWV